MAKSYTKYRIYDNSIPTDTVLTAAEISAIYGIDARNLSKYSEYGNRKLMHRYTFIPESCTQTANSPDEIVNTWNSDNNLLVESAGVLRYYTVVYKNNTDIGNYDIPASETVIAATSAKNAAMAFSRIMPHTTVIVAVPAREENVRVAEGV